MSNYDIVYCGHTVGSIVVEHEGLYMRFTGRLVLPMDQIYRLGVQFEDTSVDLGILITEENHFYINAKVPVKRMGKGEPIFCVTSQNRQSTQFIAINRNERFEHISLLPIAVLHRDHDRIGILISDSYGIAVSTANESQ